MFGKVISVVIFLTFAFPLICGAVNPNDIAYEKVNPSNTYSYNIKRLKEKISLTLIYRTPAKKISFLKTLLTRRIAELKYTVDNDDISNLEKASQRYSTTVGQITEIVSNNNLGSEKDYFKKVFSEQTSLLEQLQTKYKYDSGQWLFLKWDIDYLKLYSDKLSN